MTFPTRRAPLRAAALALALTATLAACGGGSELAADGAAEPAAVDNSAEALSQALIDQAERRARPIAPCTGLTKPVAGAPAGKAGEALPDLTLDCLAAGDAVNLADLRGPLVLNAWASWCGPCVDELPYLLEARAALGEKVRWLGLDLADEKGSATEWMQFHQVPYPSLVDPKGVLRGPLRIPGPPVTLFINSDGSISGSHYGAFTSTRQVQDAVATHLGVSS